MVLMCVMFFLDLGEVGFVDFLVWGVVCVKMMVLLVECGNSIIENICFVMDWEMWFLFKNFCVVKFCVLRMRGVLMVRVWVLDDKSCWLVWVRLVR